MRKFNKLISSVRARVEQAYGLLKGRFPALKLLGTPADMQDAYRTVEALAVIHNFCIDNQDHATTIPGFDGFDHDVYEAMRAAREGNGGRQAGDGDDDEEVPGYETNAWLREAGLEMREQIFAELFPEGENEDDNASGDDN